MNIQYVIQWCLFLNRYSILRDPANSARDLRHVSTLNTGNKELWVTYSLRACKKQIEDVCRQVMNHDFDVLFGFSYKLFDHFTDIK